MQHLLQFVLNFYKANKMYILEFCLHSNCIDPLSCPIIIMQFTCNTVNLLLNSGYSYFYLISYCHRYCKINWLYIHQHCVQFQASFGHTGVWQWQQKSCYTVIFMVLQTWIELVWAINQPAHLAITERHLVSNIQTFLFSITLIKMWWDC